jgi:hypothetical protein
MRSNHFVAQEVGNSGGVANGLIVIDASQLALGEVGEDCGITYMVSVRLSSVEEEGRLWRRGQVAKGLKPRGIMEVSWSRW